MGELMEARKEKQLGRDGALDLLADLNMFGGCKMGVGEVWSCVPLWFGTCVLSLLW